MAFEQFLDPVTLPAHLTGAAIAIGNFDGVHRGHLAVIDAVEALARGSQAGPHHRPRPAIALSFEPHPRSLFRPDEPLFRLTPPALKARLLERTGLDALVTLTFDRALAGMTAEEFLEELVVRRLGAHAVAVGYDFHFGKDRRGTPEFLVQHGRALGLDIAIVAPTRESGEAVSSSAIRRALAAGEIARANRLLGHEWSVLGTVVHGEKRGRELGFPTANMALDPQCGLALGIYAVRAVIDGVVHAGVASFGRRPTFDNGPPLLETFVFDYSGDLYGKEIEIAFVGYIRGELKFDSIDALVERMNEDSRIARQMTALDAA
ncbi:bifunctional riboflavin kinase/FAD synthetase [Labrys sp. KNU-23]|uniref:bifunctional riboflavin kinase/FAD synthetase n=1 Tax=Labrys sp. KNU-23 TaxID=2789216 RepID=UPI0011EF9F82|nr:bifunctional riboflavin kinase/FAD synthetase [Labrys sp. KNU-23]QEN89864.1 bifunctional riboflavin kinase/FAD synthetase [Labrys sp. KNU-23]